MARIYFSGGDVMLEGYGPLDSDAQAHLANVTVEEAKAAFLAGNVQAFHVAMETAGQISRASHEAHRWQRASA